MKEYYHVTAVYIFGGMLMCLYYWLDQRYGHGPRVDLPSSMLGTMIVVTIAGPVCLALSKAMDRI